MSVRSSAAPELLAPAGTLESLQAAIANGADAVYFGLDHGFNARARAGNFPLAELPQTMALLHGEGLRGYVTLNTLAFSEELEALERTIEAVTVAGVDAVLVQDLGVARLVRAITSDLELHASTQMTLTCAETIEAARELGLDRVVLARELSLDEIRRIRAATDMPLEIFVHGALCVAYSGQCLTSESLGGRSANRGQCAQACRLPYDLVCDGQDVPLGPVRYLLSPQDLAAYSMIPELIEAGIASFKIEGRLKTPEYVANITRHYRQAIDAALAGAPKRFTTDEVREMELSFSRGFSPGWLEGNDHKRLVPGTSSAKRGVLAGRVERVRGRIVSVVSDIPLQAGDGVVFDGSRETGDEVGGRIFRIERHGRMIEGEVPPGRIDLVFAGDNFDGDALDPGQEFRKTDDPRLTRKWRQSFQEGKRVRKIGLAVRLEAKVGEPLTMEVLREGRVIGRHVDSFVPETARRHRLTADDVEKQLGRLGGTPFVLEKVELVVDGDPMVPLSVLGNLRRVLSETAAADVAARPDRPIRTGSLQRLRDGLRHRVAVVADDATEATAGQTGASVEPNAPVVGCRTLEQVAAMVEQPGDEIECDFQDMREYREAVKLADACGKRLWIAPPRIMKPGEGSLTTKIAKYGAHGLLARNLFHVAFCRREGIPFLTDFSLNATNELTVDWLAGQGATRITTSFDLDRDQLRRLVERTDPSRLEVVIHQHMPMFHMEHCVFCALLSPGHDKTDCGRPCDRHVVHLRDRIGMEHRLKADVGCRNTLFNAVPQSGAEVVHDLVRRGVGRLRIDLLDESPTEAIRVRETYARLLAGELTGTEVWQRLKAANRVGVTRGTLEARRDPLAIL